MKSTPIYVLVLAMLSFSFHPSTTPGFEKNDNSTKSTTGFLNCTTNVDAGEDIIICAPGETVSLNGVINGDFLTASWSPANLVSNPTSLSTDATVNNNTTFELTVRSFSEQNLIVNGDFSQGDMGFFTSYIPGTGGGAGLLSNEGQYAIASNAGDTHNQFANCNDHTGGGNMMVVNASGTPDSVWCQDITVATNTEYVFSAWVTSVTSQNPAELQFSINGTLLGSQFDASSSTCNWTQFSENWLSDTQTDVTICIVNVNMTPAGNDFALDDISFTQICETTDEVMVTIADLDASWSSSSTTFCENEAAFDLNDLLESTATQGGDWTIDGNLATMLDPATLSTGSHTLAYTVTQGNCMEERNQEITIEALPNSGVVTDPPPFCEGTPIIINLFDQLAGQDMGGTWSETSTIPSTNDAFNSTNGTFAIPDQQGGIYTFAYTVAGSAVCPDASSTVSVIVVPNPVVDAGVDNILSCTITDLTLSGSAQNCFTSCDFLWTTSDGNFTSDPANENVTIDSDGSYTLTVTSQEGCVGTDEVVITENTVPPIADAGEDIDLGCEIGMVSIGGSNTSMGSQFVYEWTSPAGNPIAEPDIPFTEVEQEGIYQLLVTNSENGCTAIDEVMVSIGGAPIMPTINVSPPDCNLPNSAVISVDQVSGGLEPFEYALDNGTFSAASVFSNLEAGNYEVTVKDANGCEVTEQVTIAQANELSVVINSDADGEPPSISLGSTIRLDAVVNVPASDLSTVVWNIDNFFCDTCLTVVDTPAVSTTYSVIVTDSSGCSNTAELSILVDRSRNIFIPNAFSPNDDGINDIFYINAGTEVAQVVNFMIFDRWGNAVFQKDNFSPNDPTQGWDGKVKGEAIDIGVFVYFAEIEMKDGFLIVEKGEVSLVR